MKLHELKTINPYFIDIWEGVKTFEIRRDDRDYEVGDLLDLKEFDETVLQHIPTDGYSGRSILCQVTYKIPAERFFGLIVGYCALGIRVLYRKDTPNGIPI